MTSLEISFLNGIQNTIGCKFCDIFFGLITHLGDAGIFWILLACVFLILKKTRKAGIGIAIALALGLIFGNVLLKNIICRTRPFYHENAVISAEQLLISIPKDYSFPSGHTLASFSSATVIFAYNKKWGTACYILAALIAFSRMYLFVHFPTDILAGFILSLLCSFASIYIVKRFFPERKQTDS